MLHKSFKPAKCKTSLKLAISRIKLMKNKKGVQINQMKRDLSQLLETGQDRTARIRVEHVIREEKMVAAYELIEIYCELIVARMSIIESQKICPLDLKEAVTSVVFAAPRCSDISELSDIRKHFTRKYGKDFISTATELRPDCGVSRLLVEKLSAVAPDVKTKIKVLSDVAKEHNIKWDPTSFEEKESKPPSDLLNGPSSFEKISSTTTADPPKIQASSIEVVQSREEKQDAPIDFAQQNRKYTLDARNTTSTDNVGVETSSVDTRSSGVTSERMEKRQPVPRGNNDFSSGRENWNMEFKDATSAAQAAAESAERAAMAARAAAKFSRDEKIVNRYSTGSHVSDGREEPFRVSAPSRFTDEGRSTDSNESSSDDRKPEIPNQKIDRNEHNISQKATERFTGGNSQKAAAESAERAVMAARATAKFSRDEKIVNRYSTGSHVSDVRDEPSRVSAPSRFTDDGRSRDSNESSSDDRKPKIPNQKIDRNEHNVSQKATERFTGDNSRSSRPASFRSDNDSIKDEKLVKNSNFADGHFKESLNQDQDPPYPKMTTLEGFNESKSELTSGKKESFESEDINYFAEESTKMQPSGDEKLEVANHQKFTKKSVVGNPFAVIDEKNLFTEATKTSSNLDSRIDNEAISDDDDDDGGPRFDMGFEDDELSPTRSLENDQIWNNNNTVEHKSSESPLFTESVSFPDHSVKYTEPLEIDDHILANFDHSDGPDSESETDIFSRNPEPLSRKTRIELNDLVEKESSFYNPEDDQESVDILKVGKSDTLNQSDDSDAEKELNFGTLTGGLRNNGGLRFPPYPKSPATNTSDLPKKSIEESSRTGSRTSGLDSYLPKKSVEESSRTGSETSGLDSDLPKKSVEESSRTGSETSGLDSVMNRMEDKKPNVSSDSDSDDYKFPVQSSEKASKQANTRSRYPSSVTFFDDDDGTDSEKEEIVSKQESSRVRLGSGLSRRTRGPPAPKKPSQNSYSDDVPDEPRSYAGRFTEVSKQIPESPQTFIPRRKTTEIGSTAAQEKTDNRSYSNQIPSVHLKEEPKIPTQEPTRTINTFESGKTKIIGGSPSVPYSKGHVEPEPEPKTVFSSSAFSRKSVESGGSTSSVKKASHVHPKLPEYDSIAARLESLRTSRP